MTAALGNTSQGTPFATGVDSFVYPQFIGNALRAPSTNDIQNPGTRWQNNAVNPPVIYETTGAGVWYQITGGASGITSITGSSNQINASTVSGATTLSIPSNFIAPGSVTSTTSLIAGNGINITTGDITFSGNGNGFVMIPVIASGPGSGSVKCDGRVGSVTFTGVTITAGSSVTLVMENSSIKDSSSVILYSLSGATTGTGLSISSITNSTGTSTIVLTNATGASTQVNDLTFIFLILQ